MPKFNRATHGCMMGFVATLALTAFVHSADAAYSVLYTFCSQTSCDDGAEPQSDLMMDGKGNLYGSADEGGATNEGAVFKLAPDGTESVLHSFHGKDGANILAGLVEDSARNLYGATWDSGAYGRGTIFKLTPKGHETVLHDFTGGEDGANCADSLIVNAKGELFGIGQNGGKFGDGVVFKLNPNGKLSVLHAFAGGADGSSPWSALVRDKAGNLYGTTAEGGSKKNCNGNGCGTVYKIASDGTETVLYAFKGGNDGVGPRGDLVLDKSGNFYGTTASGGGNLEGGTVFKLAADGTESVLYRFCSQASCSDGAAPTGGVVSDRKGNLYGTTDYGGANCLPDGCGTVFKLSPNGTETVLHSFGDGSTDGQNPSAGLIKDSAGNLYGTTLGGGPGFGGGTVFEISEQAKQASR